MTNEYKTKPGKVEAIQFIGSNYDDILDFTKGKTYISAKPGSRVSIILPTFEGPVEIMASDYIVKINNHFYPCKSGLFKEIYEEVLFN